MGALEFAFVQRETNLAKKINLSFDEKLSNTLWVTLKKDITGDPHNFTEPLLREMRQCLEDIKQHDGQIASNAGWKQVYYAVMKSDHPNYFSLGGDLHHFRDCIRRKDKGGLFGYSKMCLDILRDWADAFSNATTIALVQGRAFGGGFEAALNADYIIAEEQSTFSFPEIMFGLFPCTGGMSLLSRRIGVIQAERMMSNNRIYKASELHAMGVIDEVCSTGSGELTVEKFITTHSKRRTAHQALKLGRNRLAPLDYSEMLNVVNDWVCSAMNLGEEELKVMDMLITMQQGQKSLQSRLCAA
jgi:DSF synthase